MKISPFLSNVEPISPSGSIWRRSLSNSPAIPTDHAIREGSFLASESPLGETCRPLRRTMNKIAARSSKNPFLEILQEILPKTTKDPKLSSKIIRAVQKELVANEQNKAFERFCKKTPVPNLEDQSIQSVENVLKSAFPDSDITVKPIKSEDIMALEVGLKDGTNHYGELKVDPAAPLPDDPDAQDYKPKFIPFPVALPGDPENVWFLAKREDLSNDDAGRALTALQADFWESRAGQKALKKGAERSFPEFIDRVQAGVLREIGIKRHYKAPEAIKLIRLEPVDKKR